MLRFDNAEHALEWLAAETPSVLATVRAATDAGLFDEARLTTKAESLTHLGDAHAALGEDAEARHAWLRALAVLDRFHAKEAASVRERLERAVLGPQVV